MSGGLVLFDGNGLAWRVTTGKRDTGFRTVVLYQVSKWIAEHMATYPPGWFPILFFDGGFSRMREKIYPAYKANRKPSADTVRVKDGISVMREALEYLDRPYVRVEGVEADDLMACVAVEAAQRGVDTVIVSDDSDMFQVLGPKTRQFVPRMDQGHGRMCTAAEALADWRGDPAVYRLWKSLRGDPTDNVPGVRGIGEKHAHHLAALAMGRLARVVPAVTLHLQKESWAQSLKYPEGQRQLELSWLLIGVAREYAALGDDGAEAESTVRRVLERHQRPMMISREHWATFRRTYDAFDIAASRTDLERIYGFRVTG